MKTISPVESKFVRQFQDMVAAFQIQHQVTFSVVNLEWMPDGTTNYDIQSTPNEPAPALAPEPEPEPTAV